MKLQPLEDRIVVRTAEAEEKTASGLVIPDTAKEKPQQGEVLAVGPGRRAENSGELIAMELAPGDTVVYSKYGGTEITIVCISVCSATRSSLVTRTSTTAVWNDAATSATSASGC